MTKEQLEAENERLGAEVAALRELLTVIAGGNPPMYAVPGNHRDGWLQTGHDRLVAATGAAEHAMRHAGTDGFTMTLRAMSGYLRHEFDRPLGYEPKAAEPAPADEAWRPTPKGIEAAAAVITDGERDCPEMNEGGWPCHRGGDHGVHRDSNGDEWRTDGHGGVEFGPFDADLAAGL